MPDSFSVRDFLLLPVRHTSPHWFSGVKTNIRGSLHHIGEHLAKLFIEQDANTGAFCWVIFCKILHEENHDLMGNRASGCTQTDMVFRKAVPIVKPVEIRVIFPKNDMVFLRNCHISGFRKWGKGR